MLRRPAITPIAAAAAIFVAAFLHAADRAPDPAGYDAPPPPAWLEGITRVAYTDLPNTHKIEDWPEKVIADFAAAGVQMMFSRCHSGDGWQGLGWRSQHGAPEPRMGDRDGTREVVALCRKHGIRYITYYLAQREPECVGQAHPEWRAVNADGKPYHYFCYNTGARGLVRDRIVELVRDVGVDGVFFDMFHGRANECYCAACREKFRALAGQDPPAKEDFANPLWARWVEFKYRSIEDALLDFNRAIKAANKDAALIVNSWNAWVYRSRNNIRSSIRVADCVDGLLEETGWYDVVDPSFFAFPARHNFMNWHLAGICRENRAFMWAAGTLPGWRPVPETEARIRVATMMSNGSVPAHSVPGRETLAAYMKDIVARDKYFAGSRLAPWCGLVVSERSELWYGRDDPKERYVKGVYGAFQAMLERHLPVSLVTDRDLELGRLEPHRVLLMPNCAAMSDAEMETVRRFVREGGGLVTTYETSLCDPYGQARDGLGLADVLGARGKGDFDNRVMRVSFSGPKISSAHMFFGETHRWSQDPVILETLRLGSVHTPEEKINRHVPLHCRMLLAEAQDGKASALKLNAYRAGKGDAQGEAITAPALIESRFGKGRVFYFPADITWSFFRYGHEYLARLIELAVREAAGEPPPAEVAAPACVQAMTHRQGDRLVVHLLNDISTFGRSQNVLGESLYLRREILPIRGIRVTFRDKSLRNIRLVPGDVALHPEDTRDGLRVTIPEIGIHAMVVAEE